jgi:hypothetical protein
LQTIIKGEIEEVMVAGELAGKGINPKHAATSDLEKFYIIFGVRRDGLWLDRKVWQDLRFLLSSRIFNIHEFKTFQVTIDFIEERTVGGGRLVADLSHEVEKECPVARKLGGVKSGLGEGLVWTEVGHAYSLLPCRF